MDGLEWKLYSFSHTHPHVSEFSNTPPFLFFDLFFASFCKHGLFAEISAAPLLTSSVTYLGHDGLLRWWRDDGRRLRQLGCSFGTFSVNSNPVLTGFVRNSLDKAWLLSDLESWIGCAFQMGDVGPRPIASLAFNGAIGRAIGRAMGRQLTDSVVPNQLGGTRWLGRCNRKLQISIWRSSAWQQVIHGCCVVWEGCPESDVQQRFRVQLPEGDQRDEVDW